MSIILLPSLRSSIIRVQSSTTSACNISANPQITDGFDGQELIIEGSDSTKTVQLNNGTGLQLAGGVAMVLKQGDVIKLHYNSTRSLWIENYRSINQISI